MYARFSKKVLQAEVQERITSIQKVWGFDPGVGWAQVPYITLDLNKETVETAVYYGKLMALLGLADEFKLEVNLFDFPHQVKNIGLHYKRYVCLSEEPGSEIAKRQF